MKLTKKTQDKLLQRISGHESSCATSAQGDSLLVARGKKVSGVQHTQYVDVPVGLTPADVSSLSDL